MLTKENIEKIFERFSQKNPIPRIELDYSSPYTLLIAVLLSARTTDKLVNIATDKLFARYNTPEKIVALGEEGLKKYINTIGLFNNKAKNIILLSKQLIEKYNSEVPRNREALMKLPGIGRKSANVVLNTLWKEPCIAVDTHVFRVSNRIGMCKTKDAESTCDVLERIIPKKWHIYAHHWLVLHGRYVCKARKPECTKCLISDLCEFKEKNL